MKSETVPTANGLSLLANGLGLLPSFWLFAWKVGKATKLAEPKEKSLRLPKLQLLRLLDGRLNNDSGLLAGVPVGERLRLLVFSAGVVGWLVALGDRFEAG